MEIVLSIIVLVVCVGWFCVMLWPRKYMKEIPLATFVWYACILGGFGVAILIYIYGR